MNQEGRIHIRIISRGSPLLAMRSKPRNTNPLCEDSPEITQQCFTPTTISNRREGRSCQTWGEKNFCWTMGIRCQPP